MRRLRSRRRVRRQVVGELVSRLDGESDLEAVLQATLRDEALRVAYPLDGDGRFVGAAGDPITLPDPGDPRLCATPLEHEGRVVAIVVHDRALAGDGELLRGIAAAAALAAANVRLSAELEASLAEVRISRARVVAEADAARRRAERDLHDGAQQRLVAAALEARMALAQTVDPELRRLLERTCRDLQAALAELRELARGLYPATLPQQGLAAALTALAERAAGRVEVGAVPAERLPARVEECAYFCVAAGAPDRLRVDVERAGAWVTVTLAPAPAATDEIRDRVEAIGGSTRLDAGRLVATLPVDI